MVDTIMTDHISGFGLSQEVLFDVNRMQRLYAKKWFFVGTRGDVPKPKDYLKFTLFDDEYFLLHGTDGDIRCMVNRCAHQSARLLKNATGTCSANIICPNHQWAYDLNGGKLIRAAGLSADYPKTEEGKARGLNTIPLKEVSGLLFACLSEDADQSDLIEIEQIMAPYTSPFNLDKGGYKLAHHESEVIEASWLHVMINNRECCHCNVNHRGLIKLFDPSSFNGGESVSHKKLFDNATKRWDALGLKWQENPFSENDCFRIARYPMKEEYQSITFDGKPASKKLIGPFKDYDQSTLSIWFNPNAWIHYTSDHIATNWVLPLGEDKCKVYSSWIVHEDAVVGEDYEIEHLIDVWKVTNAEDVGLCESMTNGAKSKYYRPGPFAPDERFCTQYCDWYMEHSS